MIRPGSYKRKIMLKLVISGTEFRIGLLFPAVLVILFTLDKTGIPAWCVAASAMHEAGHFITMYLFRCRPSLVSIGLFGIRVEQNVNKPVSYMQSMLISLSGPAVNLVSFAVLLVTTGTTVPAMIHLIIAVLNLLPIESLDGGQALYFLLAGHSGEERAERICFCVSIVVLVPLATVGFFLLLRSGYNFTLLVVSIYLGLLLLLKRKYVK